MAGSINALARLLPTIAVALLLSACEQSIELPSTEAAVTSSAPFAVTKEETAMLTAMGHANAIAKICNSEFEINRPVRDQLLVPLVNRATASGMKRITSEQFLGLSSAEAQAIGAAYRRERGIENFNRETWCAAGRYEVSNRTEVGKYLIGEP